MSDAMRQTEPSLGELFARLTADAGRILRDEVQLAKTELQDDVRRTGRVAAMFGTAGIAAFFAVLLLSFAAAWGLAEVMAAGWAFLIVGAIWAAAGALLYAQARQRARGVNMKPEQTMQTLKEDVQWAKSQKS
jgi:hypothetical protein